MKRLWLKSWRRLLATAICLGLCCFVAFVETNAFYRIILSGKTFWEKILFFFQFFFDQGEKPTMIISGIATIPNTDVLFGSIDFEGFFQDVKIWFLMLFTKGYFLQWVVDLADEASKLARWIMILGLVVVFFIIQLFGYFDENQSDWRRSSKPLEGWNRLRDKPIEGFRVWLRDYAIWFFHSCYFWFVMTLLAFSLRLFSVAIDLIGEYFFFFASFDFVALLDVILSDLLSILAGLRFVPLWIKAIGAYVVFRLITCLNARKVVEGKLIPKDEKMVDSDTGVFTLILGKMRGGKTTLATAFGRIVNTIYHKNAYDNMNRVSLMFPEFPYQPFERDIVRLASRRRIVNMQQAAGFAYTVYEKSIEKPFVLYGYDVNKKRSVFYDGAVNISIADALAIYAESYWIYFHGGNLIASNYTIRTDDLKLDKGHLVLWDTAAFQRKNRELGTFSSLSHVLVWDMLRFGKKVDEKSKFKDAAGPMVVVATEFGKEYGNMVTNSAYQAIDDQANPKNDLLDYSLKLGGHLANIWHTNFFKFIADEQRSGSLSSNLVDVAQTIFTADPKNQREMCALKLWWVEPIVLNWFIKIRDKFYTKYRFKREDKTLLFHFLNSVASFCYQRLSLVYNRYGYREVILPNCTADSSGNLIEGDKEKFYIINYIDFAYRFESASMKDFLNAKKGEADYGFFDLPTYKTLMPSKEEWDMQGSYVVSDLEDPSKKFSGRLAAKGRNGSRRHGGADRSGLDGGGAR